MNELLEKIINNPAVFIFFIPILYFIVFANSSMKPYHKEKEQIEKLEQSISQKRRLVEERISPVVLFSPKENIQKTHDEIRLLITEIFLLEQGLPTIKETNPAYRPDGKGSSRWRKEWKRVRNYFALLEKLYEINLLLNADSISSEALQRELLQINQDFILLMYKDIKV